MKMQSAAAANISIFAGLGRLRLCPILASNTNITASQIVVAII
jgi:hypothetical protein